MRPLVVACLPLALLPLAAPEAETPMAPLAAEAALACAAMRYRGQPLRMEAREGGLIQEIRWLTPAGNVLRIELTGPHCRFLAVHGVGQTEARLPPRGGQ